MGLLVVAGGGSLMVALLHVVIVFLGAPAYRYFGAGEEMARAAEAGSWRPALVTLGLVVIFAAWSAYAFSGAGWLQPLPLLAPALWTIGVVFTLRGLVFVPQLAMRLLGFRGVVPVRHVVFSAAALGIGLAYVLGTWQAWASLRTP